jgi:hypothetical protein
MPRQNERVPALRPRRKEAAAQTISKPRNRLGVDQFFGFEVAETQTNTQPITTIAASIASEIVSTSHITQTIRQLGHATPATIIPKNLEENLATGCWQNHPQRSPTPSGTSGMAHKLRPASGSMRYGDVTPRIERLNEPKGYTCSDEPKAPTRAFRRERVCFDGSVPWVRDVLLSAVSIKSMA